MQQTVITLGLILHFLLVGTWLGRQEGFLNGRNILKVFLYFFVVHLVLGLLFAANPEIIDPRRF